MKLHPAMLLFKIWVWGGDIVALVNYAWTQLQQHNTYNFHMTTKEWLAIPSPEHHLTLLPAGIK